MHRLRISCRPMFGTTQRRRCDHDGAFQIGSTQESGWSVVSYDLGYIGLEAKTLLRRFRVDRCTDCVGMIGPSRIKDELPLKRLQLSILGEYVGEKNGNLKCN